MVVKLKNTSNSVAVFLKKDYTSVSVKPGEYVLIEESFILRKPSVLVVEKTNESKKSEEKVEKEIKVKIEKKSEEKIEKETEVKSEEKVEKENKKVENKQKKSRRTSKKDKND